MMKQKANEADQESDLREAFKIFDRDKDGFIDLKELKTVATMLGSMLTKEEVEEFMREADVVRHNSKADITPDPDNDVVIYSLHLESLKLDICNLSGPMQRRSHHRVMCTLNVPLKTH